MTDQATEKKPEVKYVMAKASSKSGEGIDLLWGMRGNTDDYTYNLADGNQDGKPSEDAYNTDLTKQRVDEKIKFKFKHALAKLGGQIGNADASKVQQGVKIILDIDNNGTAATGGTKEAATLVTVNEIEIQTVADYKGGSATAEDKAYILNEGWFDLSKGTWSDAKFTGSDAVTFAKQETKSGSSGDNGTLNTVIAEPSTAPTWTSGAWSMTGVITNTPTNVYTNESNVPSLFMIPSATIDQKFVVRVKYTVRTRDEHLATLTGESVPCTKVVQDITNYVTIPKGTLKANTYYALVIRLGLTSVKFEAQVADWDKAGDAEHGTSGDGKDKNVYLPSNTVS